MKPTFVFKLIGALLLSILIITSVFPVINSVNHLNNMEIVTLNNSNTLKNTKLGIAPSSNSLAAQILSDDDTDALENENDLDADGDGIPNREESFGQDPYEDKDADGVFVYQDVDDQDPNKHEVKLQAIFDFDSDGIANFLDLDSDDDGIPDLQEVGLRALDINKDGRLTGSEGNLNGGDNDDNDNGIVDVLDEEYIADANYIKLEIQDIDEDGIPDFLDTDSDGDKLADNLEAQATLTFVPRSFMDSDKDGWDDAYDTYNDITKQVTSTTSINLVDTDKDGLFDYLDTNSDDDGYLDFDEGLADEDKDGILAFRDTDDNGDGLMDCSTELGCGEVEEEECKEQSYLCPIIPDCYNIYQEIPQAVERYRSDVEVNGASMFVVGDVDGDGENEVVVRKNYDRDGDGIFYVLDGKTLEEEFQFRLNGGEKAEYGANISMADLDKNGYPELYITYKERHLMVYEYNPITKKMDYKFEVNHSFYYAPVHFADFNNDGDPEFYVGSSIYSKEGNKLIETNYGTHFNGINENVGYSRERNGSAIAADIDGDDKLELIAGAVAYKVNFQTKELEIFREAYPNAKNNITQYDGFTSIADWDADGKLDAIIMSDKGVYVWGLEVPNPVPVEYPNPSNSLAYGGKINACNVDNDKELELIWINKTHVVCLDNDMTIKWTYGGNQNKVHDTNWGHSSSVYDFNGDGEFELVFRDYHSLSILEGKTGQLIQKFTNLEGEGGTSIEYPIIVDVNQDGQANILAVEGSKGNLVVLGAKKGKAWTPTRTIHNQQGYHNTNINDDLTVPQIMSPHHTNTLTNGFMNQVAITIDGKIPAADVSTDLLHLENKQCGLSGRGSVKVHFVIENTGDQVFPFGSMVSFYKGNPSQSGATLLSSMQIPRHIQVNTKDSLSIDLTGLTDLDEIFWIVNDENNKTIPFQLNDLADVENNPSVSAPECNFSNNLTATPFVFCKEDIESVYTDQPIYNIKLLADSSILRTVNDEDGKFLEVKLLATSNPLPDGVALNEKTGEIYIEDYSKVQIGITSIKVKTTDILLGETEHDLDIIFVKQKIKVSPWTTQVNETGTTATFTISVESDEEIPAGKFVRFPLSIVDKEDDEDDTEIKLSQNGTDLTDFVVELTKDNNSQEFTITGLDDKLDDGDVLQWIKTGQTTTDAGQEWEIRANDIADVEVKNRDNDIARVSISPISLITTEVLGTNHQAAFYIVLNTKPEGAVKVSLAFNPSAQNEGSIDKTELTFTPENWNIAQAVTVTAIDDGIVDGDQVYFIETTEITSTQDSKYDNLTGADIPDVRVTNLDKIMKAISVTATDGSEAASPKGKFTISLPDGETLPYDLLVNFSLSDDSSDAGKTKAGATDHGIKTTQAIIEKGKSSVDILLQEEDDALVENDEILTMTLGASPDYTISAGTATATIVDNDEATLNLKAIKNQVQEGDNLTYYLELDKALTTNLVVDLKVVNLSTVATDYSFSKTQITIESGNTISEDILINALEDDIYEVEKDSLELQIIFPVAGVLKGNATAMGYISEASDKPKLTLESVNNSVVEGNNLEYKLVLDRALSVDTKVVLNITDNETSADDYEALATEYEIEAGKTELGISLNTKSDAIFEETETLKLSITTVDKATKGAITEQNGTITEASSKPKLTLESVNNSVVEGENLQYKLVLDRALSVATTVVLDITDNETSADDYEALATEYEIEAGKTELGISLKTKSDAIFEETETLKLSITTVEKATKGAITEQDGTITEASDKPKLTLESVNNSVVEGNNLEYKLVLDRALSVDTKVVLNITDNETSADDYEALATEYEIEAGKTELGISLKTKSDAIFEETETLKLSITTVEKATKGAITERSGTIRESLETPKLSLKTKSPSEVKEGENLIYFIELDQVMDKEIEVEIQIEEGTAESNDYSFETKTFIIPANSLTSNDIMVNTIKDKVIEEKETLNLSIPESKDYVLNQKSINTIIKDNSLAMLSIEAISDAEEDDIIGRFLLSSDYVFLTDTEITISIDGTAENGKDYELVEQKLILPAGKRQVYIPIYVISDDEVEDTESVEITLLNTSQSKMRISSPEMASISIYNNDKEVVPLGGFSPNGDGINDVWKIHDIDEYLNNKVTVFNRWGNIVFETKSYDNTTNVWDGSYNGGGLVTDGTYYYLITFDQESGLKPIKGYIVIK